jgi:hypothetical protein
MMPESCRGDHNPGCDGFCVSEHRGILERGEEGTNVKRTASKLSSLRDATHLLRSSKNAERLLAALARARTQEKGKGQTKVKRLAAISIEALKKRMRTDT